MQPVRTRAVAREMGISEAYARRLLTDCEKRGLVERIGQRGGWKVTKAGERFLAPPPRTSQAAAAGDP